MDKKTYRLCLLCASVAGILLFIFSNSMMPAQASGAQSTALLIWLNKFFPQLSHHLLRKIAHFCEYALLGMHIAAFPLFVSKRAPSFFLALALFGTFAAVVDEGIQSLVPGRGPSVGDVLIDSTGYLSALFSMLFLFLLIRKKRKVKNDG